MSLVSGNLLGAGARYVLTDRDGIRATPSRPSALDTDAPALGASAGPFAHLDLARHVGDDAGQVDTNRAAVATAIGLAPTDLAFMEQVHGPDVATVTRAGLARGEVITADALVTQEPGLALAVMVADCVPVVFADDRTVAVAHAGRKGVQSGVVAATVAAMTDLGSDPSRITAVIGPAICPQCYEVPDAMRDEVAAVVPAAAATSRTGTAALHLRRAVAAQLASAGVGSVDAVGGCTAEDATLYSYRRDGVTGRFAMFAWLDGPRP